MPHPVTWPDNYEELKNAGCFEAAVLPYGKTPPVGEPPAPPGNRRAREALQAYLDAEAAAGSLLTHGKWLLLIRLHVLLCSSRHFSDAWCMRPDSPPGFTAYSLYFSLAPPGVPPGACSVAVGSILRCLQILQVCGRFSCTAPRTPRRGFGPCSAETPTCPVRILHSGFRTLKSILARTSAEWRGINAGKVTVCCRSGPLKTEGAIRRRKFQCQEGTLWECATKSKEAQEAGGEAAESGEASCEEARTQ